MGANVPKTSPEAPKVEDIHADRISEYYAESWKTLSLMLKFSFTIYILS